MASSMALMLALMVLRDVLVAGQRALHGLVDQGS